jgi:lipoprotein-releasing system permease protein
MYKLLLSWRYLKTRFIALASIVSVTLGVATLIVVNSVMSGFVDQMKSRLHGILSDVEIAAPLLGEISYPEEHLRIVREVVGDDLEALTTVVRNPALLSFDFHGRQWTQQVMLLGIDDETFGKVTDFEPYLTNALKKTNFSFELENDGYGERLENAGWPYRRQKAEAIKAQEAFLSRQHSLYDIAAQKISDDPGTNQFSSGVPSPAVRTVGFDEEPDDQQEPVMRFAPLPDVAPDLNEVHSADSVAGVSEPNGKLNSQSELTGVQKFSPFDPHAGLRPKIAVEDLFDPGKDQYTGIILGIAISSRKFAAEDGTISDLFMVKPGDDVQVMFPTVGANAQPVSENCTIVDFYSSNMHEYDSSFAFMPLSELQKIRGMVDPLTGQATVSTIQIKLKEGADLTAVRDKLIAKFPPHQYPYDIHTWLDSQAPLLSAVDMELTILNILLFMIIAVAGFGILATFFMIVVEKTRDIGILKALGAPSQGVMSIFLGYGMSLGSVGTGAGIILGLLFVRFINEIADVIGALTGREVFDPTIYYFAEIPTIVSPWMVLCVAAGAISIAVLASVLPALRAARLHPVEALRYE